MELRKPETPEVLGSRLSSDLRRRSVVAALLTLSAVVLLQGCLILNLRPVGKPGDVRKADLPKVERLDGDRVYSLLGPDSIPAIDEPDMVTAQGADFMADDEQVLGVVVGGQAAAYSIWHLDRHEIVNDTLGDEPLAVTW